jgi:CheY-like chemotaxis protein/HPt (histidine-containing phosphotransfer) domain-containing protein
VLTALVVDPSATARRRVGVLLRLGGWHVVQAADAEQALLIAASRDLDLIVTEVALPGETGLSLLARLRKGGSRARLLVVTKNPTERIRAAAAGVGALGCLAKPLDPWALIDFLRRRATGPAAQGPARHLRVIREVEDLHDADVDADTMDRLQEMYVSALPHRLSMIADGARSGDAMAVAAAAQTLAGASGQLGHPAIAMVCQEIAAEARRGVVSQVRLMELQEHCLKATRTSRPAEATVLAGI